MELAGASLAMTLWVVQTCIRFVICLYETAHLYGKASCVRRDRDLGFL